MKVITWNVNSIRQRLARTNALLARQEPDVLCVQETKALDAVFPFLELESTGYRATTYGQSGLNGVAIFSREEPTDVVRGIPGAPVPEQARAISATIAGVRVINVYVINGKQVGAPEYETKLRWLDALATWIAKEHALTDPVILVGDFNVTPDDRDVHDPGLWRDSNLASEPERARIRALTEWGFTDLARVHHEGPGPFTWWDYRAGAFHKGWGLRIDLALGTAPLAERCTSVEVEREERKPTSGEGAPSDHAPLIVTLD